MCHHIVSNPSLKSLAYNLVQDDRNDLLQELALIVCEKSEPELEKMDGYFNFWCVRTLINMCGKRGNFTKLYNPQPYNFEDLRFDSDQDYDATVDEQLEQIDDMLKGVYWYKRELFKTYFELGTYRAVEEKIGIDHSSVFLTVKEVKEHIKNKL